PHRAAIYKVQNKYPDFDFKLIETPVKTESSLFADVFEEFKNQLRSKDAYINQLLSQQAQLIDLLGKQKGNQTMPKETIVRYLGLAPQLKVA
ncbi:MAG: hypothetical protein EBX41_05130, partial [Chitinophagia bacterium]|nr:hypothetical protein [Chitinophagia bacterium]